MNAPTIYTVWCRSDGYIAASAHSGDPWRGIMYDHDEFEELLTTPDWPTARKLIIEERDKARAAGTWLARWDE